MKQNLIDLKAKDADFDDVFMQIANLKSAIKSFTKSGELLFLFRFLKNILSLYDFFLCLLDIIICEEFSERRTEYFINTDDIKGIKNLMGKEPLVNIYVWEAVKKIELAKNKLKEVSIIGEIKGFKALCATTRALKFKKLCTLKTSSHKNFKLIKFLSLA